jgi:cytochrome c oxidase subunit 2
MVVLMHVLAMLRTITLGAALVASTVAGQQAERRTIKVSAERFAFTPSRIEVFAGEEVELRLRSDDTSHGFRILGAENVAVNVAIPKRGKGEITVPLRIDKPGTYRFECSRMCGAGHDFMHGEIVVKERTANADHQDRERP